MRECDPPPAVLFSVQMRPALNLPVRIAPNPSAGLFTVHVRPFQDSSVRGSLDPSSVSLSEPVGPLVSPTLAVPDYGRAVRLSKSTARLVFL